MKRLGLLRAVMIAAPLAFGACALKKPPSQDELARQSMSNVKVPPAWTAGTSARGEVGTDWLDTFGEPRLNAVDRRRQPLRLGQAEQRQGAIGLGLDHALHHRAGALRP